MPSFSDIPTEIVIEIGSYLSAFDDTTQVSLALACRRFYAALIDMMLIDQIMEIEKLSSSSKITPAIYNDPKAYHATKKRHPTMTLRLSPSDIQLFDREEVGNSGSLHIIISGMTRKELQSLRYLVSRARHLKKLVLELYVAEPGYNIQDVVAFINTCLAKPDLCLHMYGGLRGELQSPFIFRFKELGSSNPVKANTYVRTGPDRPINNPSTKLQAMPAGYTNHSTPSFSVTKRKHEIHDDSLLLPQISTLALEGGEIPFMLPFYPVILNALRSSTITSLTLKWIPFSISLFHWGQIIPCVTLPMLKELTIGKVQIAFPDLLSLLERHPTVETLDLSNNNVIGVVKLPSQPILPCLVSLTANLEYLLPFIEHKIRGHFPVLKALHTRPFINIQGMPTDQYSYVKDDLHPVFNLLSTLSVKNLSFYMTIGAEGSGTIGLVEWLLNMGSTVDTGKFDKSKSMPLAGVRTLVVENSELWRSPGTTERLFEWFKTYRSSLDERTVDKEGFMNATYKEMFEVLIWNTCLQLDKLEIAGNKSTKSYVRELQLEGRRVTKRR